MLKLEHPASLNAYQQYRQASQILKRTSRASNPAWYQDALSLEHQLHIRCDGEFISTHYFKKSANDWTPGPPMDESVLRDPEKAGAFSRDLLTQARSRGAKAMGVVVHIANEFATAELKPEFEDPAMLPDLREAAISDPASILDDSSLTAEQASWRLVPYPAGGGESIATAAILSRQLAPFLDAIRECGEANNFPLITHALSAPLVALTALGSIITPTDGKPFVGILQYPWFTAVGFFNHEGELRLIRTMQHRGRKRVANFRHALNTTNASLELVDPDVLILPLGEHVDHMLGPDLQISMPESRIEVANSPADAAALPPWCLELWLSVNVEARPNRLESQTMSLLQDEKWALQNFLPIPTEVAELYPGQMEMRMLRYFKLARVALFLIALGGIGWLGVEYTKAVRQQEWAFNEMEATQVKNRLASLTKERAQADHWHNLLADRSKGWVAMEDLVRMFPENSGIKVRTYQYAVKPETAPRQTSAGFVREWKITGLARPEGAIRLNEINTREGISTHFAEVARLTGNQAYRPDEPTRSIVVSLRTQENRGFRSASPQDFAANADNSYPFTFDLVISQRFEPTDPLALNAKTAP
ncbi:MAG: hypothetical protein ACNA8L_08085 [Luteolibacter sp.]